MEGPSNSKRARVEYDEKDNESEFDDRSGDSDVEFYVQNESEIESDSDDEEHRLTELPIDDTRTPAQLPDLSRPSSSGSTQWFSERKPTKNINFLGTPGVKIDIPGKEPIDYFNVLFTDDFYDLVVRETNAYAIEVLAQSTDENSRINRWKDLTTEEFRVWLGLLFHMGSIRVNKLSDYWKTDELFNLKIFPKHMPRDRFLLILRSLHFNRNSANNFTLDKIQPLIDFFNKRMEMIYAPKKNLSIDESLMLWRGRLVIRQYIKGKKAKYGIKLYMLAESNGIALKLIVYGGTGDKELGGKNHTNKVVFKLMHEKTGYGHSLFMDNFYNSVQLTESMLKVDTYITGTLRSNRKGNPVDIVNKKLKRGEASSNYTEQGVCVTKWKDKREVLSISSEFDGELTDTTNRFGKQCIKPNMISNYNKCMSGIDFHDQMMAYYPCQRKTLRWYKKLGIHLFQTMFLNAYYLYKENCDKKIHFINLG